MAGNLNPIRAKERLTAGFPTTVPAITGEVVLHELIRIWQHCKKCAQGTATDYDTPSARIDSMA